MHWSRSLFHLFFLFFISFLTTAEVLKPNHGYVPLSFPSGLSFVIFCGDHWTLNGPIQFADEDHVTNMC